MNNTYDCNPVEKGVKNTFEAVDSVAKGINKIMPNPMFMNSIIKNRYK